MCHTLVCFYKCLFDCHYSSSYDDNQSSNHCIHNLNFPSSLGAPTNEQRNPWKHLASIHQYTPKQTLSLKQNIVFATLGSKITPTMTWMINVFLQTLSLVMQLSFSSLWLSHRITFKVFWILRPWLCVCECCSNRLRFVKYILFHILSIWLILIVCFLIQSQSTVRSVPSLTIYAFLIRILQFITLCWFIFVIWDVSKKWICPSGWSFMNQSAKSSCAHNRCALYNWQCDQPITGTQKYRLSSSDFYGCDTLFPPQWKQSQKTLPFFEPSWCHCWMMLIWINKCLNLFKWFNQFIMQNLRFFYFWIKLCACHLKDATANLIPKWFNLQILHINLIITDRHSCLM